MSHKRERLNDFLWEYDTYADMLADAQNISLGAICKTVAGALYVKTQKELTYLNAPGATGTTGDTGQTGDTGPPGTGMTWLGAWSSITTYLEGDGVENNGSTYIALGTNTNSEPPSINWDLVADKGATGSQGNPGADGATGPQGNPGPNSVSGTTASTLTGLLKGTGSLVAVASAPTDFVATGDARLSDARIPLAHAHTIADTTGLQTALDGKAASLGADDNYVTDAEKVVIGNTSGTNTGDQTLPTDATIATTDVTTNNVSTTKHGWTPKAPNDTSKFLRGDGTWATTPGGSEAFPVGAVFIAVVDTNPGTLLGYGTWSAFAAGRVLVGLDSGQTEFDVVEETGGAKTHTLTTAELPAHNHQILRERSATTGGVTTLIARTSDTSSTVDTNVFTANAGSGTAHNNLQPYIVVYMWKRTA